MGIDPSLARSLALLDEALGGPPSTLPTLLGRFATMVGAAVPSYVGLRLVVRGPVAVLRLLYWGLDGDLPVPPPVPAASVLVPLVVAGAHEAQVVLLATAPGAFVDLAADLAVLTGVRLEDVVVDGHLDPAGDRLHGPGRGTGLGVLEAATVDQAIGALLAHGWTPEEAVAALGARAADRSVGVAEVAAEVLEEAGGPVGGWWSTPPPTRGPPTA